MAIEAVEGGVFKRDARGQQKLRPDRHDSLIWTDPLSARHRPIDVRQDCLPEYLSDDRLGFIALLSGQAFLTVADQGRRWHIQHSTSPIRLRVGGALVNISCDVKVSLGFERALTSAPRGNGKIMR